MTVRAAPAHVPSARFTITSMSGQVSFCTAPSGAVHLLIRLARSFAAPTTFESSLVYVLVASPCLSTKLSASACCFFGSARPLLGLLQDGSNSQSPVQYLSRKTSQARSIACAPLPCRSVAQHHRTAAHSGRPTGRGTWFGARLRAPAFSCQLPWQAG